MKVGDLVTHNPIGSPIEVILQKMGSAETIESDFYLGVIVDKKNKMCQVFSHQLKDVCWYEEAELALTA